MLHTTLEKRHRVRDFPEMYTSNNLGPTPETLEPIGERPVTPQQGPAEALLSIASLSPRMRTKLQQFHNEQIAFASRQEIAVSHAWK